MLWRIPGATEPLALSPDGKMLATAMRNAPDIAIWDTTTGKETGRLHTTGNEMMGLAFSPDGRLLASSTFDSGVTLWDIAARRALRSVPARGVPAFSPVGKMIAISDSGDPQRDVRQRVVLYDLATGRELRALNGATAPIAFSPDGSRLAAGGPNNMLEFWDVGTGMKLDITFKGHRYGIQTCVFSPDGRRLAAGDVGEYNVILWDTATGCETFHISGRTDHTDIPSYTLAFSPDGMRLYSGNQDGVVKVW